MSVFVRVAVAAVLAPAAAVAALLGADLLPGAGADAAGAGTGAGLAAQDEDVAEDRQQAAAVGPSRYDRFSPPPADNLAAAANAACGFAPSLSAGGTRIEIAGTPSHSLSILRAEDGEDGADGVFRSFTARTDAVHAFARFGELYLQTGHTDRDGFAGRVWTLDEAGEPTFSGPLLERGRVALACEDAQAAVDLINGELARPGHTADPVRAGVRAFEIGDGVEDWVYPRVDAFVDACTPEAVLAGLPAGASFVLTAEHDAQARFGESIVHAMSGESLAGSAEPMIYVVLAEIDEATGFAGIRKLHIPLSWSDLPHGEGAVSPVFRYEAIEVRGWTIEPDGARGHGESAGGVESVSIPCADPQAGAEALEAFRDEASR